MNFQKLSKGIFSIVLCFSLTLLINLNSVHGQEDFDGDGIPDGLDNCTGVPNGLYLGTCSNDNSGNTCMIDDHCGIDGVCSMDQEDYDEDGVGDVCDHCTDVDGDGYGNPGFPYNICSDDNCPDVYNNPDQDDNDQDGLGDVCDPDDDNDAMCDPGESDPSCTGSDNCQYDYNPSQEDTDEGGGDGVGDICDNCPNDFNPAQQNHDPDALGDVCDPDDDNDGICDPGETDPLCSGSDICPYDPDNDIDEDTICGDIDNCPTEANPNQEDVGDGDGVGDICDNCPNVYNSNQLDRFPPEGNGIGDACECEADFNCDGNVDAADVTDFLIDFGRSTFFSPCTNGDPCKGDFDCEEDVDVADMVIFREDFGRGEFFNPCPPCEVGDWCVYP